MFFLYILKSKKDKSTYIGYTRDLRNRLKKHNLGLVRPTKSKRPLQLVYYETYTSRQDATKREHNLKLRAKSLKLLLKRIENSLKV